MNRLEANISLLIITFFSSIQYVFLANVPATVSTFAFLSITNLIGFVITLAFFFRELFRVDKKQVLQSLLLAGELFGFNVFLLIGSNGMEASVTSAVVAAYFVFVAVFLVFFHQKLHMNSIIGMLASVVGVFCVINVDVSRLADWHILCLILADIFFAAEIITVDKICSKSNPAVLAMGQMFFGFLLSSMAWGVESVYNGRLDFFPTDSAFWISVLFISFFIRGLYGIIQTYAQRYVSALSTSLIFATEIVMTLFLAPLLSRMFGTPAEEITPIKAIGSALIVAGVLVADGAVLKLFKKKKRT